MIHYTHTWTTARRFDQRAAFPFHLTELAAVGHELAAPHPDAIQAACLYFTAGGRRAVSITWPFGCPRVRVYQLTDAQLYRICWLEQIAPIVLSRATSAFRRDRSRSRQARTIKPDAATQPGPP
jgi:hypothetical protein